MPRKGYIAKRDVLVDPIYNSKLVTRLINKLMLDGKKNVAQDILYNAFDIVEAKTGRQPMEVFEQALSNIMPLLELKVRRVMKRPWNSAWLRKVWMRPTALGLPSRRRKIPTRWPKPTRPSLITAGKRLQNLQSYERRNLWLVNFR